MQNWRKAIRLTMWIVVGSIALATPNRAQADFVFNITQRDVGAPISVGSETIFDVTVARGPNLPSVDNLAGISFFVGLGDPANWGGTHPAGVLRSGTNDSSSPLAGGRPAA